MIPTPTPTQQGILDCMADGWKLIARFNGRPGILTPWQFQLLDKKSPARTNVRTSTACALLANGFIAAGPKISDGRYTAQSFIVSPAIEIDDHP